MFKDLFLVFAAFMVFVLVCAFAIRKSNKCQYLGQRVPPDMEFIPGNDSIPSFFISKSQESNLNYVIYLDWLQRVYVDYPEVVKMAQPHDVEQGLLYNYNDPYLQGQLRNPAFAYYPVTGLDWLQVQDYLIWKTDRLNESIMIELGYFKYNPDQTNEDNFNTEAFLASQYEAAAYKKYSKLYPYPYDPSFYRHGDAQLASLYPLLMPGYRLPTEAEWEFASKSQFSNNRLSKGETYPYGRKYFPLKFIGNNYKIVEHPLNKYAKQAGKYEPSDMNRIKGGTTYDNRYYGVYNMGDNVKEWLMDEYSPKKKHYPTISSIFEQNGFILAVDSLYKNTDGYMLDKDSIGRMHYRVMGVKNNGDDLRVMRYNHTVKQSRFIKVLNPDSLALRQTQLKNLRQNYYYKNLISEFTIPLNSTKSSLLFDSANWMFIQAYKSQYYSGRDTISADGKQFVLFKLDTNLILNSLYFVDERKYINVRKDSVINAPQIITRTRVVKSGTWRNPSVTAREPMLETDASADVGFRTVIQYLGMPVDKKNMVKWK